MIVSLPAIGSLMIIVSLIMFIFAIIAVNLLKGKSFYCNTDNVIGMSLPEIEKVIKSKADCEQAGGFWDKHVLNFDNIGHSVTAMFVMS